jgi:hypothetical protein
MTSKKNLTAHEKELTNRPDMAISNSETPLEVGISALNATPSSTRRAVLYAPIVEVILEVLVMRIG